MLKTILIDFDGVINTYTGKYDKNIIPFIREGAYEFLEHLSKHYNIKIFTSRNLLQVSEWLIENNLRQFINDVTNVKEPSYLIIDDRCVCFNGDYVELKEKIENFKVWYK